MALRSGGDGAIVHNEAECMVSLVWKGHLYMPVFPVAVAGMTYFVHPG